MTALEALEALKALAGFGASLLGVIGIANALFYDPPSGYNMGTGDPVAPIALQLAAAAALLGFCLFA